MDHYRVSASRFSITFRKKRSALICAIISGVPNIPTVANHDKILDATHTYNQERREQWKVSTREPFCSGCA
jgi:hypothetical protein